MRILSLFLLAAATAACGRGDDAPADRIAAAPVAGSCGGKGDAALALTARSVVALPDSALPAGLVLLPDGSLVTVERGSAGVSVHTPGSTEPHWVAAPEPLAVLTLAGGELLAAGLTTVYRIDPAAEQAERLVEVPVRVGRIVSLAADARTLWVGTGGVSTGSGAVYATPRAAPGEWRHLEMEAPVRLEAAPDGRAAAALTRAPHRVVFLDAALTTTGSAQPPPARARGGQEDARFTQALIGLDCGRLLHVISDLRSDRREMNVYQATPRLRLVRARTIEQPLGFVHALDGQSLVAVRESGGRREVVLFGWSWQHTQEGT